MEPTHFTIQVWPISYWKSYEIQITKGWPLVIEGETLSSYKPIDDVWILWIFWFETNGNICKPGFRWIQLVFLML